VTQRNAGPSSGVGGGQEEYWKKKLMAQKQEYENKLEASKKQIELLQKKEEDRQKALQKTQPVPAQGRGKKRKTSQYQLMVKK